MDREQYARLREQYLRALELPLPERAGFAAQAFAGEPALRSELASLLAALDGGVSFLGEGALGGTLAREALSELPSGAEPKLPERVGDFRILGLLGRGGMGIVLRAEQSHPQREVALKLMRPGLATADSLRRLRLEAELLGRLQHPGIAQVYAAGTWKGSFGEQPYLALELVRGKAITQHADERGLDVRGRLELFASVCDAVQHAHQKGVIHRDLKPANVLVDAEGRPKVLDFGVARLAEPEQGGETFVTQNSVLGTLSYMSPEQAAGQALDTRSDIYSLGCLAYRLLSGRVPVEAESSSSLIEGLRAVQEVEPPRLGELDARLRGDIETIVSKTLEKDPERRYASASDLSADVRSFLEHRPIAARPPTACYLLGRFARRHRGLVAGAAAVLLALLLGLVGTVLGLSRARAAEREALSEADEKRAVNDFLLNLFAAADPEIDGREVRVASLLDRWAKSLDTAFPDRPLIEAGVRSRLGATYQGLGLLDEAEPHLRRALAARERLLPPEDRDRQATQNDLAVLLMERGSHDEAHALFTELLALRRRALGETDPATLAAWSNLGANLKLSGRLREAETTLREALAAHRQVLGEDDALTRTVENSLGMLLFDQGRLEEAGPLLEHAAERAIALEGPDDPKTLAARGNLGMLRHAQGRMDEAELLLREVIEDGERVLAAGHPRLLGDQNNLAVLLWDRGRKAEAVQHMQHVVELRREKLPPGHVQTLTSEGSLGGMLLDLGRLEEAEPLLRGALERWTALGRAESPPALAVRSDLAQLYGRPDWIEPRERALIERLDRVMDESPQDAAAIAGAERELGRLLFFAGRHGEAEALLLSALERLEGAPPHERPAERALLEDLVRLYEAWSRADQADRWRASLAALEQASGTAR